MEHGIVNWVVALVVSALVCIWLFFTYWQIKLLRRIHVVSRTQHQIPENVFWLKRARMAIETDVISQNLVRKRNFWAAIFVSVIVFVAVIVTAVAIVVGEL